MDYKITNKTKDKILIIEDDNELEYMQEACQLLLDYRRFGIAKTSMLIKIIDTIEAVKKLT